MAKTKRKDGSGNYASLGSAEDRLKFLLEECVSLFYLYQYNNTIEV